jgi:glycosyltransferase involved in cell wall biosynthesis
MRIAILAPEFPPEIGGMQRYAWEIACGLAEREFAVTVFTRQRDLNGIDPHSFEIVPCLQGSHWQDREIIRSRAREFDLWHVMNAAWAWIALETSPVFVSVHGNDFLDPNRVVRLGLRDRFKVPFGSRLDHALARWMTMSAMRKAFKRVMHVFVNSKPMEALFLDRFPNCQGKTTVTHVGVSESFLSSKIGAAATSWPPRLITISRLDEPRKNVDVVLRALACLKDAFDFRYSIIGDGCLRPGLERLARDLGLSERVAFLGVCSDERLQRELVDSNLFILTSAASPQSVEGFGIVYLEANACGVPVLAARVGGAVEAVSEGRSGMFVDMITPESIADAVGRFLSGAVRFDANECREFAQEFAWPTLMERIVRRYEETLPTALSR